MRLMSDDVLVMKDGEVVEHAAMEEILDRPTQEFTKRLMAAVPRGYR
jgi:peptide/nickel transport system ATP-binding protein